MKRCKMLEISHLSHRYRDNSKDTLRDISLSVKDGEIVALVGRNGSGKSTLGRLIAGISNLQTGTVRVDAKFYDKSSQGIRQNLGIVFQNPENQLLFNKFDEEIRFALPGLSETELEERIQKALTQVGMNEFRKREVDELSLGQKQRLVLAEVLARGAKHLILDEPTTMIDSEGKGEIAKLVRNLARSGYSILYITNLADEILLADRTLVLADSQIVAEIKKSELVRKVYLLKRYHIELPVILQLLAELKRHGIDLAPEDFDVTTIAKAIEAKLYG